MEIENDELVWLKGPRDHNNHSFVRCSNIRHVSSLLVNRKREWIIGDTGYLIDKITNSEPNTFVIFMHNRLQERDLQSLFNLLTEHKIQRLIFQRCEFQDFIEIEPPLCLEEVVFSDCERIESIIRCFLCLEAEIPYKLRTLTLRHATLMNIKNVTFYISVVYSGLSDYGYYITKIKLIESQLEDKHPKIYLADLKSFTENNILGQMKYKKVCTMLLTLKKLKLSKFLLDLDINIVKIIVGLIWRSRHKGEWRN